MFGISIFMSDDLDEKKKLYIKNGKQAGFNGIFTSMHIPEDDSNLYKDRLKLLGKAARKNKMELMVDISGITLEKAGFSMNHLQEIIDYGVSGLRMDYQIDNKIIASASHAIKIALNASTITTTDIDELKKYDADFTRLEAWHNYYPHPNTGLSRELFIEKNLFLKKNNFKVMAFIAGDSNYRVPLFMGLPTLEEHRDVSTLASLIDLNKLEIDSIYVGDEGMKDETLKKIDQYLNKDIISLRAIPKTNDFKIVECLHENREDAARDVIRSAQARFKEILDIFPENTIAREVGSITIDNKKYGRYMGEVQIVINPLEKDEKVNVVGQLIKDDIPLIKFIGPGQKFCIEKEEKIND